MDKTQLKFHHRLLHCHKIINCHTTGQGLPYLLHRMTRPTTALGQQRYQETVVDHSQLKFQFKLHHRLLHCHLQLLPCFRAALCESVVMDKTQLKFHHRLLHCHKIINCHTTGLCLFCCVVLLVLSTCKLRSREVGGCRCACQCHC